jgi:uncharacterized protein (DUF427 family)
MTKAIWNGTIIAQTDQAIEVEGNQYFPVNSVDARFLQPSAKRSTCHWKGEASYFDVLVDGQVNKDAAWSYPAPKEAAKNITGYVAFWKGVQISA